ncbi:MAG TPA: MBL fold metallo-hydrolase [Bacteroidota bacterium]|jgi:glyoxylase-like metal-dependent hydrolase (beta-lactamase superfamily II)/rhodanese-related sulfurtransferase|nr:MBL fold metallo-hydrolase [Bacteroidota bacterium]
MVFQQFRHEQGGCLSYIVGCTRRQVCAVIDPQLDIEQYLDYARHHGMKITDVFETHAQADHLSGAKKLSLATGAPVHFHESVEAGFPVAKVTDGQEISIGNITLKVLHTPGHTPDSVSILVSDTTRSREPWLVFTGDTLFVGDTGRPDLDGSAAQLYESVWGKLLPLPDCVEIYPTHFAGSSCGKAMSPKPSSTIGYERRFNPSLQMKSKGEFVDFVMADLPVQPPRFQKVRQYNLGFLNEPPIDRTYEMNALQITVEHLKQKLDNGEKPFVLDVREPSEYAKANIGGKLIPLGEIPKRIGELDKQAEIVVHCHHGGRSQRAVEFLYEQGFKNVKNLVGGIDAWSVKIDANVKRY